MISITSTSSEDNGAITFIPDKENKWINVITVTPDRKEYYHFLSIEEWEAITQLAYAVIGAKNGK